MFLFFFCDIIIKNKLTKKMNKKISFPIALIIILFLAGIVIVLTFSVQERRKESISEDPGKFDIGKEKDIFFLREGDIWIIEEDVEKKIIKNNKATYFDLSPDGEEVYWLNEKGELWKRKEGEPPQILAGAPGKIEYEKYRKDVEELRVIWQEYIKDYEFQRENMGNLEDIGKIINFVLSPNGEYLMYEPITSDYTSCCMAPPSISSSWIWIMKNDGTEKVEIEKPIGLRRNKIVFNSWFPNSQGIIFHFRDFDEYTTQSFYFEIGIDGKNPELYTQAFKFFRGDIEIEAKDLTAEDILEISTTVGSEPVYSPTGKNVAHISEWEHVRLINIETKEGKIILKEKNLPLPGLASSVLVWSEDGNLLAIRGNNKLFIFDKKGSIVFEKKFTETITDRLGFPYIGSVFFSSDNKYIGGVYKNIENESEIIFFENLITGEKKEFELSDLKGSSERFEFYIEPQFFSSTGNFYYLKELPGVIGRELWVIDVNNWNNYKITSDVSLVRKHRK